MAERCDHDIVVSQDPQSGTHEFLRCTKGCGMEPKRRVTAAESIRLQAEAALAEMRIGMDGISQGLSDLRGRDGALARSIDGIHGTIRGIEERLAKLEAFGGAA